ncbi:MAG: hypothetical protein JW939_08335 [Candidatus Thermoplasmatota archaeon]|nr:hypothetical protein [Candidatus Thermoplasmatota archaeon]
MGKLEETGSRMGLSENDVWSIRRERSRWAFLAGIGSLILAILAFILGLILGLSSSRSSDGGSYPFAISGLALTRTSRKGMRAYYLPILLSLGFLTGISQPIFGADGIEYGVFSRERRN